MSKTIKVISPVDGSTYAECQRHSREDVDRALAGAAAAQEAWKQLPIKERKPYLERFVTAFAGKKEAISKELTMQMGRPISHAPGEVGGTVERATGMMDLADGALAEIVVGEKEGFRRFIRREPVGIVMVVPAWNYPYLIAVNSVVPALLAGNAVVLRHSSQTPLCAERFAEAFAAAGLPEGLFAYLHLNHTDTASAIRDTRIKFVAFTGSVKGGHEIQKVASERFIGLGLELGGKDPAYVRPDVNLEFAIENLVDGAFYNAGQSCCGIERIYVHEDVYAPFVEGYVELTKKYKLGNPLDPETNIGPVAKRSGADLVRKHIADAIERGARALIDPALFSETRLGANYVAPQVLVDVDHTMPAMVEESFGPVVGIMRVKSDEEALQLMNDSPYGLTASIWTEDEDEAVSLAVRIEAGTCFMNRCDYLDPYLAWVGVKNSGRGCSLSRVGYEYLTRPKSFHLRIKT